MYYMYRAVLKTEEMQNIRPFKCLQFIDFRDYHPGFPIWSKFCLRNSYRCNVSLMVYSHCTKTLPGTVHGVNLKYSTMQKCSHWLETGTLISTHCFLLCQSLFHVLVPVPVPVPFPCSVNRSSVCDMSTTKRPDTIGTLALKMCHWPFIQHGPKFCIIYFSR